MDEKTIRKMKTYEVKMDETQRLKLINLGKHKILGEHLSRYSLFDLFRSSIRFTRLQTWLVQFVLLSLTSMLITKMVNNHSIIFIIQSLTLAVIFSAIFFIEEVLRSFTSGMWELEQTLKYDVRQHTIIKLLIFGFTDLFLIVCLAFICQGVLAIPFWEMILYLLLPFNLTCIVLFSLFTIWRNTLSSVVFWIGSGLILMGAVILSNVFNIYEFGMRYWGAGLILSIFILGTIVMNMLKGEKWEAVY